MGKYRIISGQNLYDVALHIYGSVEGITDLLINNPSLSMASVLSAGQELTYSDDYLINADIAAHFRMNGIVPANGERNVYFKEPQFTRAAEFRLARSAASAQMSLSGWGEMEIDWGDNSPLQKISLARDPAVYSHFFDNAVSGERKIRLYGDFRLRQVDLTELNSTAAILLRPVYVEELTMRKCRAALDFLPMVEGLYALDLTGVKTGSLLPVAQCRDLMKLDLSGMDIRRETLDAFLIALVREHYGRRNCEVILTEFPSGEYREPERDEDLNYVVATGMEAVWLLTNEPAWNEGGKWLFNIQEQIYTYEQDH